MGCKGCKYLLPPYLANYNSHDKNTSTDVLFFMRSCGYLASVEQLSGFRFSFFCPNVELNAFSWNQFVSSLFKSHVPKAL